MKQTTTECHVLSQAELHATNREQPLSSLQRELEFALKQLGFFPGIQAVAHTGLRTLGTFEGGTENCSGALMHQVTETGAFPCRS